MSPTTRTAIATALRETGTTEARIAAFMATPAAEAAAARIEAAQHISPAPAPAERQPAPAPAWARFNEYTGDGLPVNYQKGYDR